MNLAEETKEKKAVKNKTRKLKIQRGETKVSPSTPSLEKIGISNSKERVEGTKLKEGVEGVVTAKPLPPGSALLNKETLVSPLSPPLRKNEKYIDVLEKLSKLMSKKGEPMRSRAYAKAQETIMNITTDITKPDELKGKPGIGPTILEKLKEFDETGTLRLFEREKENPEHIFNEIYGVGPKKAKDLVEKGIRSIAELREKQSELLNETQRSGLKYYEDILERIPRSEIDEYNELFKQEFKKASKSPVDSYEIVGSYRRGAASSGDIDVIITASDQTVFSTFIDGMKKQVLY